MIRMRGHRRNRLAGVVALALLFVVAAACDPEPPPPPPPAPILTVTADPEIYPWFEAGVSDYVIRCTGAPVHLTVDAPEGTSISVAGQQAASGQFVATVNATTGQSFTIVDTTASRTYHVRCLPTDFPGFIASRVGETQAEYYITAPNVSTSLATVPTYAAIFDHNGVPVWWSTKLPTLFAEVLPAGDVIYTSRDAGKVEAIHLDGTPAMTPVTSSTGPLDEHDVLLLSNGNYLVTANKQVPDYDFSSWGAAAPAAPATLLDHVLQEITPAGDVVWEWDAAASGHISVAETDPAWRNVAKVIYPGVVDAFHWNSVEATPTGYLVSFRHLNAVYHIDRTTGDIDWKLGGTDRPGKSLDVIGDPVFDAGGTFGGQHDARLLADGTVTVFDNGNNGPANPARPPRAVRYAVNFFGTATFVEQVGDPAIPVSIWGGSARRLDGGNWVVAFGGTDTVDEMQPDGNRVFHLHIGPGAGIYRVVPVPYGRLTIDQLRAGMDTQYP